MKNQIKKLFSLFVFIFALVGGLMAVNYVQKDGSIVDVKEIKFNGMTVFYDEEGTTYVYPTYVYPGQEFQIWVKYLGVKEDHDVRLRVTIPGYDYDLIQGNTNTFEIIPGKWNFLTASIKLPKDILDGEYPLKIEFLGKENSDYVEIPLDIEAPVKSILDVDVQVIPPAVKVGENTEGKIKIVARIENRGKEELKHVNVVAYLKEYPTLTRTVVYLYHNTDDTFNGILEPGSVATLEGTIDLNTLPVPPKSGSYTLVVEVRYDYNHQTITKEFPIEVINVNELKQVKEEQPQKVVATEETVNVEVSKQLIQLDNNKNIAEVEIIVKNNKNARTEVQFALEGKGINAKITPAKVSVEPLGQSKATLTIEGVNSGVYPIKVKVLNENGQEIASKTIMVEVDKTDVVTTILYALLVIIFVLIIAVIVALIFKGKGKKGESNGGEKVIIQEKGPNVKVEEEELY
jgi:hypothetical protein